jgi:hypothetical protein
VLLTGGTIARLAAEGHRVIIVVACDGEIWPDQHRGQRLAALRASAAILGADKAVHLGYADSGHGPVLFEDPPGGTRFARADVQEAAGKLAGLLTGEHADLLLLLRLVTRHRLDEMRGYGMPQSAITGRRPPLCGAKASGAGGAPDGSVRPGQNGQIVPVPDQIPPAGVPGRLRDGMVRRTRRTDGRTRRQQPGDQGLTERIGAPFTITA